MFFSLLHVESGVPCISLNYPHSKSEEKQLPLPSGTAGEQACLWHVRVAQLFDTGESKVVDSTALPPSALPFLGATTKHVVYSLRTKPSLTAKHVLLHRHVVEKGFRKSVEPAACTLPGGAKLTDRPLHAFCTHRDMPYHPRVIPNNKSLAPSTVGQSDETGGGNSCCTRIKGIPQNRKRWASSSAQVRGQ